MKDLGLYIHIPFCKQKCAYCDFYSKTGSVGEQQRYVAAIGGEIKAAQRRHEFKTVYIGGGTPSVLYSGAVTELGINTSKVKEFTIEANPESLSAEKVEEYKKAGATRISLGVQSLNDEALKAAGRLHTAQQALSAMALAPNLSVDIILGLPHDNLRTLEHTLNTLIAERPGHISAYMLEGKMQADEDLQADMYELCREKLTAAGYGHYEISNFALPGKESAHNMLYWTGGKYVGIGDSAVSFLGERTDRELIIFGLRTAKGVPVELLQKFPAQLERISKYLEFNGQYASIKRQYWILSNSILVEFI